MKYHFKNRLSNYDHQITSKNFPGNMNWSRFKNEITRYDSSTSCHYGMILVLTSIRALSRELALNGSMRRLGRLCDCMSYIMDLIVFNLFHLANEQPMAWWRFVVVVFVDDFGYFGAVDVSGLLWTRILCLERGMIPICICKLDDWQNWEIVAIYLRD